MLGKQEIVESPLRERNKCSHSIPSFYIVSVKWLTVEFFSPYMITWTVLCLQHGEELDCFWRISDSPQSHRRLLHHVLMSLLAILRRFSWIQSSGILKEVFHCSGLNSASEGLPFLSPLICPHEWGKWICRFQSYLQEYDSIKESWSLPAKKQMVKMENF